MTSRVGARHAIVLPMAVWMSFAASAVDISGTVTDQASKPIEGATVELLGEGLSTSTNASGQYDLASDATTVPRPAAPLPGAFAIRDGRAVVSLAKPAKVAVGVFDTRGALISEPMDGLVSAGTHTVPLLNSRTANNVLVVSVRVGDRCDVFRYVPMAQRSHAGEAVKAAESQLAKTAVAVDSVRAGKAGYVTKSVPVESLVGTVDIVLDTEVTEYITTPEKHGWSDAKSISENTAAFQTAVNDASAHASESGTGRGVVELEPGKTYTLTQSANGPNRDPNAGVMFDSESRSNVEVRTRGKPTDSTRAVLLLDPAIGSRPDYSQICVVEIKKPCGNVRLAHVTIDGNKRSLNLDRINYANGDNGGLHCVGIDGANDCRMEWVECRNGGTDGLRIDHAGQLHPPGALPDKSIVTQRFHAADCDFHHNRRQGLSVIDCGDRDLAPGCDQVTFTRCKFRDTGDEEVEPGVVVKGQAPGAGVDLEPNGWPEEISGITFDDCEFFGNGPTGRDNETVFGSPQGTRGWVMATGAYNQIGTNARYVKVINSRFHDNTTWDDGDLTCVLDQNITRTPGYSTIEHLVFDSNTVEKNIYFEGFLYDEAGRRSTMNDCIVSNNTVDGSILFRTFKTTGNTVTVSGNKTSGGSATPVQTNGIGTIVVE